MKSIRHSDAYGARIRKREEERKKKRFFFVVVVAWNSRSDTYAHTQTKHKKKKKKPNQYKERKSQPNKRNLHQSLWYLNKKHFRTNTLTLQLTRTWAWGRKRDQMNRHIYYKSEINIVYTSSLVHSHSAFVQCKKYKENFHLVRFSFTFFSWKSKSQNWSWAKTRQKNNNNKTNERTKVRMKERKKRIKKNHPMKVRRNGVRKMHEKYKG